MSTASELPIEQSGPGDTALTPDAKSTQSPEPGRAGFNPLLGGESNAPSGGWTDAVADVELRDFIQNKGWKDPAEMEEGYRNLENLPSSKACGIRKFTNSFTSSKRGTMKLENTGTVTSDIEVLNISPKGFWLWVDGREHFLGFEDFPWFRSATIAQICDVTKVSDDHFFWPSLDVDLHRGSIESPDQFPLKSAH